MSNFVDAFSYAERRAPASALAIMHEPRAFALSARLVSRAISRRETHAIRAYSAIHGTENRNARKVRRD